MRSLPTTPVGWVILLWGVFGVFFFILNPVVRLSFTAAEAFAHPLGAVEMAVAVLWLGFMVYAEGWRGFHKQFAPRVVVRSLELANAPSTLPALLAPVTSMGLIHATRKRKIVSRCLLIGIVVLVVLVRQLSQPWRGLIDVGVVAGLAVGLLSLLYWFGRALTGNPSTMASDMPE